MSANGPAVEISDLDRLTISNETKDPDMDKESAKNNTDAEGKWGFGLNELYRLALQFYREKEGKAVNLSYQDKLKLVAFTQQVSHGKLEAEKQPPLGVLDVIGRDRRLAWQALGDMSQEEAMSSFITMLEQLCPLFQLFVEAHKRDLEERQRIAREEEERVREEEEQKRQIQAAEEEERTRQEAQRHMMQELLNQQTFHQFKAYAEQQFPGNPEQQGVLIRQLQEQHYHQYMQQLMQHQDKAVRADGEKVDPTNTTILLPAIAANGVGVGVGLVQPVGDDPGVEDEEGAGDYPPIARASMWTRKDMKEFKETIRRDCSEAVIKVGHGETVTVRVPTHEKGNCVVWEFATDNYDIGFGVFFEWAKSPTNAVTVHISESEDEDEEEEEEEEDEEEGVYRSPSDLEEGAESSRKVALSANRPMVSAIVPVYRRDCQDEVYVGTHTYPGEGVYLLKFDNSYSLWRSKTLYYRVYYTTH